MSQIHSSGICLFTDLQGPVGVAFFEISNNLPHKAGYLKSHPDYFCIYYTYRWHFNLDPFFRSNMSFNYIYFSAIDINACHFGNLTVLDSYYGTIIWNKRYTSVLLQSKYNFSFCGIHSTTVIYSKYARVAAITYYLAYVYSEIKLSFSVIDNQKIFNIPQRPEFNFLGSGMKKNIQVNCIWSVRFIHTAIDLNIYRIVVSKLLVISVRIKMLKKLPLDVYDGPGILSKMIASKTSILNKPNDAILVTTSFQCVILMYNHSALITFSSLDYDKNNISQNFLLVPGSSLNITYPNDCSIDVDIMCYFEVETDPGFQLNVSVANMMYSGENNTANCSFAGVAAYNNQTEISTNCIKIHSSFEIAKKNYPYYVFQNVYSSYNSLVLVLYSYKQYGNINISLLISTTTCKPKQANFCDEPFAKSEGNNKQLFLTALITKTTKFVTSHNEEQCIILQFAPSKVHIHKLPKDKMPIERCIIQVSHTNIEESVRNVHFNVTGFFRGWYLLKTILGSYRRVS